VVTENILREFPMYSSISKFQFSQDFLEVFFGSSDRGWAAIRTPLCCSCSTKGVATQKVHRKTHQIPEKIFFFNITAFKIDGNPERVFFF
jgi:hypothetical protein